MAIKMKMKMNITSYVKLLTVIQQQQAQLGRTRAEKRMAREAEPRYGTTAGSQVQSVVKKQSPA